MVLDRLRRPSSVHTTCSPPGRGRGLAQTLTSVRLAVATRLGISDAETADELAGLPEDDPRTFMVSVYDWLGFAQETMISAL